MAYVIPFAGIRFNRKVAGSLNRVICPPYDVINAADKEKLLGLSPLNIIRLELPDPAGELDRYRHARAVYERFARAGALAPDDGKNFYVYEQQYTVDGRVYRRKGLFGALKIEKPGQGKVLPHEKTFSGPKEDRLKLMNALGLNVSPIFMLFSDPRRAIIRMMEKAGKTPCVLNAVDVQGVRHKLWAVRGRRAQDAVHAALLPKTFLIADGHHRYETAWNYAQQHAGEGDSARDLNRDFVLTYMCPLEEKGLVILPTHRLATIAKPAAVEQLLSNIARYFAATRIASVNRFFALMKRPRKPKDPKLFGYIDHTGTHILRLNVNVNKLAFMPAGSPTYRQLDVTILHNVLLHGVETDRIAYSKDMRETHAQVAQQPNACGFILKPTLISEVIKTAQRGEVMPEKSTYFYPKLATGIVLKSLAGEV